jgi:hypothetical protein
MHAWVAEFFRNAELLGAEPYDHAVHVGVLYPVPPQNVSYRCRTPAVLAPPPRRKSVFIQRKTIPRIIIAKG